jgi:hypothetical protein
MQLKKKYKVVLHLRFFFFGGVIQFELSLTFDKQLIYWQEKRQRTESLMPYFYDLLLKWILVRFWVI